MLSDLMYGAIDRFGKTLVPIFKRSPHNIEVNTIHIKGLKQPHNRPLSIVHISDTHIGFQYDYYDLITHIQYINALQPDIVVITGDLFDNIAKYQGNPKQFIPLLKTIQAPLGTYFAYGNHDQRNALTHDIETILEASHIKVLCNYGEYITYDNESIYICGTDDLINASGNISQALKLRQRKTDYTIALVHEPDYADFVKKHHVDLQLSGHSHGGQIYFPFIGAPIRPLLGRIYLKGLYRLKHRQHVMHLHVSRGLGTTHLPIRFCSKPQITKINIT
ncbi:metallophosphoesterase [Macrococcoides caseolyticum]|uniref:metallophosphoesterase n=1 Tax=Macrococcoides caseolyticum TaxID=69966 RepID=UPI001F168396|nr:metallophosphoesterase [Macrococcus caseolyticus]MCE4956930.1 metallophosphoesterase [Macrococcus caseolyticus]